MQTPTLGDLNNNARLRRFHAAMTASVASDEESSDPGRTSRKSPWRHFVVAAVVSIAWTGVSSWLIVLNKHLLSNVGFRYPMALSGLGMAVSSVLSYMACKVFKIVPLQAAGIDLQYYIRCILPIGLLNALTMMLGNTTYLYLSMSLIQMLKAFQPIIMMAALNAAGMEKITWRLAASLAIISGGTALASIGEVDLSWIGLAYMFASESVECIRLVLTQRVLHGRQFNAIEGLMYMAPACTFWLIWGVIFMELPSMSRSGAFTMMASNPLSFSMAAMLGFATNVTAYIVVILTSSLVLKVMATVRNAIIVSLGVVIMHEIVTPLQGIGYAISIVGFAWFNRIKLSAGHSNPSPDIIKKLPEGDVAVDDADTRKPVL